MALSGVWRYDTSQAIAAPAAGYLRTNAAPVTQMAIAAMTFGGADVHADLMALANGDILFLQEVADATLAAKSMLTAAPVDHTTWVAFTVTPIVTTATGPPRPNEQLLANSIAAATHAPYATTAELKDLLHISAPTSEQIASMQHVLDAAAEEIDWELGYTVASPAPTPVPLLVHQVNLERAVEHWRQGYSPFGVIGIGAESEPIVTARNSWYRHHLKLAPLKAAYGVA